MQRARLVAVPRYRGCPRQGCRRMGPAQGARHWRLRSKKLLHCEQERESEREVPLEGKWESEREVPLEGKSRPAASAPTKQRAGFYWLAVLWSRGAWPVGCWAGWPDWLRQGEPSDCDWAPDRVAHRVAVWNRPSGRGVWAEWKLRVLQAS